MKNAAPIIAMALLAAACASKDTKTEAQVDDKSRGADVARTTPPPRPDTSPIGRQQPIDPLKDPASPLAKRSVYFDFDSNSVKDEYRNTITAHSRYMTADRKDARIRIEGNCDERGSREYNLALGQRRAEAVKKVMTVLGVQDGRIETTSYGEEKPVASGHDESAWAQNRRADIKYSGE